MTTRRKRVASGVAAVAIVAGLAVAWSSGPSVRGGTSSESLAAGAAGSSAMAPISEGLVYTGEYRNNLYDPATGMLLFWQNDATNLYVGLVSPGTGWLSVGFSNRTGKVGSNIILGAVADGSVTIQDNYGVTRQLHLADKVSSIATFGGSEEPGQTTLEFVIPLASGDAQDTDLIPGQTVQVILAYQATRDSFTAEHTRYSMTQITLDP